MPSAQLPNYLLANRKRLALSQADVAFLLGQESGETVRRHEQFEREPSLQTVLAYEAIYQKPARELFSGLYGNIEQQVAHRAKALAARMDAQESNGRSAQKRQALTTIAIKGIGQPDNVS